MYVPKRYLMKQVICVKGKGRQHGRPKFLSLWVLEACNLPLLNKFEGVFWLKGWNT